MLVGPFPAKSLTFSSLTKFCKHRGWLEKDIEALLLFVTPSANWPSYGCYGYYNFEFNNILWRNSNIDPQNAEPDLNLNLESWRNLVREAEWFIPWQERNWKSHGEISEFMRLMFLDSSVASVLLKVT